MIKFSIITVCLNAGNDLIDTVKDVLEQDYDNYELIIKDGYSIDGSLNNLPEDPRIKIVQRKDSGIYDAMNQAIEYVTGKYVIFLNAGDLLYEKSTLSKVAGIIMQTQKEIYYGYCYNVMGKHTNVYPQKISEYTCYRTMICHQSTFYIASYLKQEQYDVNYKVLGDKNLLVKAIVKYKYSPIALNFTVCRYKAGGFCESEKAKKMIDSELLQIKKENFSFVKRILYGGIYYLTFPKIRAKLNENAKIRKIYYYLLKKIYS